MKLRIGRCTMLIMKKKQRIDTKKANNKIAQYGKEGDRENYKYLGILGANTNR